MARAARPASTAIWRTVGDDLKCDPGMGCLPWYGPNEAPTGLEQIGVCAKLDDGPCVGKIGRLCVEKGL